MIHIHAKNIVSALGATALCDKEVLRQLILHEGEHIKREIAGTGASGVSAEACEELEIKSMDLDRICDLLASQDPNDPDLVAFGKAIQIWTLNNLNFLTQCILLAGSVLAKELDAA